MSVPFSFGASSRPILKKTGAVEVDESVNKKLTRGISRATDNVNLVSKARSEFALDFKDSGQSTPVQYFVETPVYTFTLPDLTIYSDEFRSFLEKDLIETSTLISLEQAGRLNWWAEKDVCQRLWPLATTGDGNCLLHAASLGMWGFHDRLLTLRKALHATLTNGSYKNAIWRRWRWQQTLLNREAGLVFSEDEWEQEWQNLLRLSSTEPRSRPGKSSYCDSPAIKGMLDTVLENDQEHDIYESLEEVHVLALAHVLRRPIIVVADTMLKDAIGEPFAPIPFGGIYLPLECPPPECHKSPLVLTYDAAHFSALVAMEKESYADKTPQPPAVIPLTDSDHQLLPIQFAVDPGEDFRWGIDEFDLDMISRLKLTHRDKLNVLHDYLDVTEIMISSGSAGSCNGCFDDKKSSGGSFESDDSSHSGAESYIQNLNSRNKATKQLQSVAKQFGSIGRTMSKKLKKNLGTLTRIGRSNSFKETSYSFKCKDNKTVNAACQDGDGKFCFKRPSKFKNCILSAVLHTEKRHEYQEEMIRNYLHSAHERFERDLRIQQQQQIINERFHSNDASCYQGPLQCINAGCSMYGTATTSYLCSSCYVKQKQQEQELEHTDSTQNSGSQPLPMLYGAGKSRFYAESDTNMFANVAKMPPIKRPTSSQDQTLYLSKSTFYNDIQNIKSPISLSRSINNECSVNTNENSFSSLKIQDENESHLPVKLFATSDAVTNIKTPKVEVDQPKTKSNDVDEVDLKPIAFAEPSSPRLCPTPKCQYFGNEESNFLCSQCYKNQRVNATSNYIVQLRTTHI